MSQYFSHLNTAAFLLQTYTGNEPFASFAKKHFSQHKKYGSKDRKNILHLCYCYFRLGKALPILGLEERIKMGLFFCSTISNNLLQHLLPELNEHATKSVEEKCRLTNISIEELKNIFYWQDEISDEIDKQIFSLSHLQQPDLFLRLRPGKEEKAISKLQVANISFQQKENNCIALPNGCKIENIIELNKEAVVQDFSSQKVGALIKKANEQLSISNLKSKISVWDCCAASGGKSIMLYDINNNIQLAVSDIRESILANLKKRFAEAGIKQYKSFVADISNYKSQIPNHKFEIIIADVPCSGSGTWGRTPEQLIYFTKEKIDAYTILQKKITTNVLHLLTDGGYFLYITCSVFKKENEDVCNYLQQQSLTLIEKKIFKGYNEKADTMFAALFKK